VPIRRETEISKPIEEFPTYEITNYGRVINTYSGREMSLSPTLYGDLTVGMMKDRVQHRRSVKVLVARAFVEGETDAFNTPILLDGDRENLQASNIVWRPRWFAWEYTRQFHFTHDWFFDQPVIDITTNTVYESIFVAATTHGNLCKEIRMSTLDERRVFPTRQIYNYIQ
jgi:hypothetical protein